MAKSVCVPSPLFLVFGVSWGVKFVNMFGMGITLFPLESLEMLWLTLGDRHKPVISSIMKCVFWDSERSVSEQKQFSDGAVNHLWVTPGRDCCLGENCSFSDFSVVNPKVNYTCSSMFPCMERQWCGPLCSQEVSTPSGLACHEAELHQHFVSPNMVGTLRGHDTAGIIRSINCGGD